MVEKFLIVIAAALSSLTGHGIAQVHSQVIAPQRSAAQVTEDREDLMLFVTNCLMDAKQLGLHDTTHPRPTVCRPAS